jgi:hypothetical protein
MVFCRTSGFDWKEIYQWNVDEFSEIYHALQRNEARSYLSHFVSMGQAFGGDKKSIKAFLADSSKWLPDYEKVGGRKKGLDDLVQSIKGNTPKE